MNTALAGASLLANPELIAPRDSIGGQGILWGDERLCGDAGSRLNRDVVQEGTV